MLIGFSVCLSPQQKKDDLQIIKDILAAGCRAVELNPSPEDYNYQPFSEDYIELIKRFSYRSIHLPPHLQKTNEKAVSYYKNLAEAIHAQSLTIHPDGPDYALWFAGVFTQNLGIENMDHRKKFGKSPEDLAKVFEVQPNTRWVYDPNHIKTNDQSMKLGNEFYERFSDRLLHYHLSGFAGDDWPHAPLYKTQQAEIIKAVKAVDKPIIIESFGADDLKEFQKELDYILPRLII